MTDIASSARIGDLRADFRASGYGADRGESAKWVRYPVWGVNIVLPNVEARPRVLPVLGVAATIIIAVLAAVV